MSSIDERVVEMKFNNGQFQSGVSSTMSALDKLKQKLNLSGASKGLNELDNASKRVSFDGMARGIEGVTAKFAGLATVGITALANITNKAVDAGLSLAKSLTIDPVMSGLSEYETQLNSVQTILANTAHEGANLKDVNGALSELNTYADKTIYNFGEMARNIGTFTAAGVDLDTSTESIKGIANIAALSGSNSQQASTAMYQLSQAISNGKVNLQDWNSVVNAGMGGKVFQDALIQTAKAHDVNVDGMIKKNGSFRESLTKEGWLTSDILTDTLKTFTGDLSDAELKQMGFQDSQIKGIQEQAKTASDAATKVKTVTQLIETLQEAAQSGWAQTWQLLFGDFEQAKVLFTSVSDTIGPMIDNMSDARNKLIGNWSKKGGRNLLIEGLSSGFEALMGVIKPVGEAFKEIFPPTTSDQLMKITQGFADFTKSLIPTKEVAENIKRTAKGLFAVLDIGWMVIKEVVGAVLELVGAAGKGSSGILDFTGNIGDFLVSVRDAIKNGEGLSKFFDGLVAVLKVPIELIKTFAGAIGDAVNGMDFGGALADRFEGLAGVGPILGGIVNAFKWLGEAGRQVMDILFKGDSSGGPFSEDGGFVKTLHSIREALSTLFTQGDFSAILDLFNTGLLGGLVLIVKKFIDKIGGIADGGGVMDNINGILTGVTDTMSAMQAQLKAGTLLKIAGAIALLTASVVVLSMIDSAKLAVALGAITIMFVQMAGAMMLFEKFAMGPGLIKMPLVAASLILLGIAMNIFAGAVKRLSALSWEELAKGIGAVTVLLLSMSVAVKLMSGNAGGMIAAGVGLIAIAVALRILVGAVSQLGAMDMPTLAKGIGSVAAMLVVLAGAMRIMPKNMVATGAGLVIVAAGLNIMATAMKSMGSMSWDEIGRGLAVLGASLAILSVALNLMTGTLAGSAALVVASAGLLILADAMKAMGGISWEEFGRGIAVLASTLLLLAGAMYLMTGALPGAAALLVVAGALTILTPVLIALGNMSWEQIWTGIGALALALGVLGVAALVLTPVIPSLMLLGAAITLLGVGTLAAGLGVAAFAAGLTALTLIGPVATAALVLMFTTFLSLIPLALTQLGLGIVALAGVITAGAPAIVGAIVAVIMALLNAITTLAPAITNAFVVVLQSLISAVMRIAPSIINALVTLVMMMVNAIVGLVPQLVNAGLRMITGILTGISNNIGMIVTVAGDIIVNFINAIAGQLSRITEAGANLIITFIESLSSAIRNNSGRMRDAAGSLAGSIISGLTGGLSDRAGEVISAIGGVATDAINHAKNLFGINSPSKVFRAFGDGIDQGLAQGITRKSGTVKDAIGDVAHGALDTTKKILGINSPSKEFQKLGAFTGQGFAKGLKGSMKQVNQASGQMKGLLKDAMNSAKKDVTTYEKQLKKLTSARKKNNTFIKATKERLAQAKSEYSRAASAYKTYNTQLNDELKQLKKLKELHGLTDKQRKARLDKATEQYKAAVQARNDYGKSIKEQYSDLESIGADTKVGVYFKDMRKQIKDTNEFTTRLQKLRKMGLNNTLYKELLASGADALPFVKELQSKGKKGVKEFNNLNGQLVKAASNLGKKAQTELYQAGVNAAEGLVKGLKMNKKQIAKEMNDIAATMVSTIKKKLKIKSPSREFAKIGEYSTQGLVMGLKQTTNQVAKASEGVGKTALDTLRESMSKANALASEQINTDPVIRPVLDLTSLKKDAARISPLMGGSKIAMGAYDRTSAIARDRRSVQSTEMAKAAAATEQAPVQFTQINNSPKALSKVEIYRNTKNQLSAARGVIIK